jgi:anti-sigma B factor antagonist
MRSTGLGVLVSCLTSVRNRGGDLRLLQPTPRVVDVLVITQADLLFEIFDNEDLAVQSFSS